MRRKIRPWVSALAAVTIIAALANALGVYDMSRFGAYCFYCLLTTVLTPALMWFAFRF